MSRWNIIKYILFSSLKNKLYLGVFALVFLCFIVSSFIGSLALNEQMQLQVVYFSSFSRIVIVIGIILFVCFYINNSLKNKEVEFLLSKVSTKNEFILLFWFSFCLTGLFLLILPVFIILIYNRIGIGLLLWSISLFFEIVLVLTFSITTSLILQNSIISIFSTGGFYFISRMMGFFIYSIDLTKDNSFMDIVLKILSSIFPRLDIFAKSEYLIYGCNLDNFYIILFQSLIYIPLLLLISLYDFSRKEL